MADEPTDQTREAPEPGGPRFGRSEALVGIIWAVLTIVGELFVWNADIFPDRYTDTAHISDDAFLVLTRLGVPVFAFVISVLIVSVLRFRSEGEPEADGEHFRGTPRTFKTWLGITGSLAVLLIIFPGLTGIFELRRTHEAMGDGEELVVQVEAARWAWTIRYPDAGIETGEEMVLPVDRTIRFEVTSIDVLHSFWIPAFRTKIDAVPGLTTETFATAEQTGSFAEDPALRIQCAELCGLHHSTMALPIRVVEEAEFQQWLVDQAAAGGPTCEPSGTELTITALDIAFDQRCLAAPAGTPFTITLDNQDGGVPHNLSIAKDPAWNDVYFAGETFPGADSRTYEVPALPAGTYYFRCDVHPIPAMSGTFIVK